MFCFDKGRTSPGFHPLLPGISSLTPSTLSSSLPQETAGPRQKERDGETAGQWSTRACGAYQLGSLSYFSFLQSCFGVSSLQKHIYQETPKLEEVQGLYPSVGPFPEHHRALGTLQRVQEFK